MVDHVIVCSLPTEQDWIRRYVECCPDCAAANPKRWYDLCPIHAPVVRCVVDPAYEAWLVKQKFYALHTIAWIDRMLDAAERIERGYRWIADDPEQRTARGMRRIAELRAVLDPSLHDRSSAWIRDLRDTWTVRLDWYETRLRWLYEEQVAYAGTNHASRSVVPEDVVGGDELC